MTTAKDGREAWAFQIEDAKIAHERKKVIIGHEVGVGKTIIALLALNMVEDWKDPARPRILILCSRNALLTWLTEWPEWTDLGEPTLVQGHYHVREDLWKNEICLATYDSYRADWLKPKMRKEWDVIICDEAHKFRSHKSATFKAMRKLKSTYLWMLTGTAARGDRPDHLWPALYCIDRKKFAAYRKFEATWCRFEDDWAGYPKVVGVRNEENFKRTIAPYLLRRLKSEVHEDMPPLTRAVMPIEMLPEQVTFYNDICNKLIAEDSKGGLVISPIKAAAEMKARQLLACPKIIDENFSIGAGMEAILNRQEEFSEEDRMCVIFSAFPSAFPYMKEALERAGAPYVGILKGGMSPRDIQVVIDSYRNTKGIILCSIKFAESFNLTPAKHAYVLGADWDPDVNEQAEGRIHRGKMDYNVTINYIVHERTLEKYNLMPTLDRRVREGRKFMKRTTALIDVLQPGNQK